MNAENELADPDSVFNYYKKLIALRHEHPIIVYGTFHPLLEDSDVIYAYDRKLNSSGAITQSTRRYYPKNRVTFFSAVNGGKLGVGLWGDAPEADVASLMKVDGTAVSPYITISQWTENDPAVLWTKASALFMPALYSPNSLWIATASAVDDIEG